MKQPIQSNAMGKPLSERVKSWLSITAVVCAGVFTPVEYLDLKQEKRVERTLGYVERYSEGSYADHLLTLDEAVDRHYAELSAILGDRSLSPDELQSRYSSFINEMLKNRELRSALNQVLRFQEELVQCVLNELCDRQLTLSFFANSTGDLLRTYFPYICERRSSWNDPTAYTTVEEFYLGRINQDTCVAGI